MRSGPGIAGGRAALALAACLVAVSGPGGPVPARAQGALSALQTDVDKLAARARPSVVTVVARLPEGRASSRSPASPRLRAGSGVAIEESAILTTAGVVQGAQAVFVCTSNGIEVAAQVAGVDLILNIAYLRVPELRLPVLPIATGRPPQPGDWVVSLGTSFRREPTQSVGTVVYRQAEPGLALLHLSNTVYPGNSGGPVLNVRGELVGLVLGELSSLGAGVFERRPGANSCMLPIEHVRAAWEDLRRLGRVRHGWIGIASRAAFVESEGAGRDRVPLGALVESVTPRSPAERVGLHPGDLVVAFEGQRVETPEQLGRWVTATRPGQEVELVWVRDEIRQSGRVALGESPVAQPDWATAEPRRARADTQTDRMAQLEREIERLKNELERLRARPDTVR
jgi:serine protease Do